MAVIFSRRGDSVAIYDTSTMDVCEVIELGDVYKVYGNYKLAEMWWGQRRAPYDLEQDYKEHHLAEKQTAQAANYKPLSQAA